MKTAVSIPDPVFKSLSFYVKKKGISRSKLISKAVEEYIKYHESIEVTAKLNRIYSAEKSSVANPVLNSQIKLLEKAEW